MRKKKSQSMLRKILVLMISVMLIQTGLFCGALFWGGTIQQLDQNAFDILDERVINRKNYLENEMIQRWSNVEETVDTINHQVENYLQDHQLTAADIRLSSETTDEVLKCISDDTIYMLRRNSVTGVFVILSDLQEQETTVENHSGFYLRDLDPESNPSDNSDLMIERAPSNVTKYLGIPLDSWWTPLFTLDADTQSSSYSDFYYQPYRAALEHPEMEYQDLGYWSRPFSLSGEDISVISYSVPLRLADGSVYGVLGVEISLDYLRSQMPYQEILPQSHGAYLLAIQNEEGLYVVITTSGPVYKELFGEENSLAVDRKTSEENIFVLKKSERSDAKSYGCVEPLQLYNTNTPFEQDQWVLLGVVKDQTLLSFSQNVELLILLSAAVSLAIGIVGILILSTMLTRPIKRLVQDVKQSDPMLPVHFDPINIVEIDQMASAVEHLSNNVADSASKLAQIISLTNMPIGAFEYRKDTHECFCTEGFFTIMGIPKEQPGQSTLSGTFFQEQMNRFTPYITPENEDENTYIYHLSEVHHQPKWVRLKITEDANQVLGVAVDITQEMLEKRKIEYERDYDILTNLLNRRAFHAILHERFAHPEQLKIAALIMMDLDNLKYINDTYGHDYGDLYIQFTANAIKKFQSDQVVLSRMSGDEFYLFIYGYDNKEQLRQLIETIKDEIRHTVLPLPNDESFKIRASAGIAWYPEDSQSYEKLIKYADFAMYKVKNTTKGEFSEFDIQSYNKDAYLLHSREELNKLIDGGLVEYHFQPIVDVATGAIFGYEALMRSKLSTLKTPKEILSLARIQSKLNLIEQLTWTKALEACEKYRSHFLPARKVFINSIPSQSLSDQEFGRLSKRFASLTSHVVLELIRGKDQRNRHPAPKRKDPTLGRRNCHRRFWHGVQRGVDAVEHRP